MRRAFACLILLALATPAVAQGRTCASDRAPVAKRLSEKFGEMPVAVMLSATGRMVELFANPGTGSWTMIEVAPSGQTCLTASGQGFQPISPAPAGEPA